MKATPFDRRVLVVAALLAALALIEICWPHDIAVSASAALADPNETSAPVVAVYPVREELGELAQRPLFTVDRRPYVPPPSAETSAPTGPPPPTIDAALVGIARAGDAQVILVQLQNATAVQRLRLGGQIEGWTVTSIGSTTATLTSNGHDRELSLVTAGKR